MRIKNLFIIFFFVFIQGCRNSPLFYNQVDHRNYQEHKYSTIEYNPKNDSVNNIKFKDNEENYYKVKHITKENIEYKEYDPIHFNLGE